MARDHCIPVRKHLVVEVRLLCKQSQLTFLASVSKYVIDISTKPKEPQPSQEGSAIFAYEKYYDSVLQRKKTDKSYRYFRNINRIVKEFPTAHSTDEGKRVKVWCSNDYVRYAIFSFGSDKIDETISLVWEGIPL
jgi:hypothetical protein